MKENMPILDQVFLFIMLIVIMFGAMLYGFLCVVGLVIESTKETFSKYFGKNKNKS